ncbi:MAG: YqhG family protein [Kyrpidia sp.]|nr:YqhG family protein [Kyrpidia sp.]
MQSREDIRQFAKTYFETAGATILDDSPQRLTVRVPIEIDKELTDRPYYWMWVEATGEKVEPQTYTFLFDPEGDEENPAAEWLAPASFRLQKMYDSACRRGRYVRQFEICSPEDPLLPLLLVYCKVSYISDRRKDRLLAMAVDLFDGRVAVDPKGRLPPLSLSDQPKTRHLMEARVTWPETRGLLEATLRLYLNHEDHRWAEEAITRRQEEERRLARYFEQLVREREESRSTLEAEWSVRLEELRWRFGPRIVVTPLQWAWLCLTPATRARMFTGQQSPTRP